MSLLVRHSVITLVLIVKVKPPYILKDTIPCGLELKLADTINNDAIEPIIKSCHFNSFVSYEHHSLFFGFVLSLEDNMNIIMI